VATDQGSWLCQLCLGRTQHYHDRCRERHRPQRKAGFSGEYPIRNPTLESNAGPQGRVPMDYRPGSQSGLRHRRIILVAIQVGLATETILPGVTLLSRIIAHIRARSLLRVFCG
jgi:hypothetical protein